MDAQRAYARFAGLMYLVVLVLDIGGLVVQSAVSGSGSFGDVSHRIVASEALYRVGLCLGLGGSLATILLAAGLYVTVKPADGNLAMVAHLFRAAEAVIGGVGIGLAFLTLQVYLAANHPGALDAGQLAALADLASNGDASTQVAAISFTCGSTVFVYLFWKSATSRGCSRHGGSSRRATGVVLVATIRRDGSPRLSPVEPLFREGELWLGMGWETLKAADLMHDRRVLVPTSPTSVGKARTTRT